MRTALLAFDVSHPLALILRRLIEDKMDPEGPLLAEFDDADNVFFPARPHVLLVVLSPDPDRALAALNRVRSQVAGRVLAVGPTADPKLILRTLQEGADHYLDKDNLAEQFAAVLPRLKSVPKQGFGNEGGAAAAGQTISVLAAGGGCGASTLAVNLAVVLAAERQRSPLVDLKPGVGDLAALLDLKPAHTLADLCLNPALVDEAMLDKAGVAHSSGVRLLAAPMHFEDIRLMTPRGVRESRSAWRAPASPSSSSTRKTASTKSRSRPFGRRTPSCWWRGWITPLCAARPHPRPPGADEHSQGASAGRRQPSRPGEGAAQTGGGGIAADQTDALHPGGPPALSTGPIIPESP